MKYKYERNRWQLISENLENCNRFPATGRANGFERMDEMTLN